MLANFLKKVSSLGVHHFLRMCIWLGDREDAHFQLWNVYYLSLFDHFTYVALISHAADDTVYQSMPITSVRRSWPMQILKCSLYVMKELLKMTDVS